MPPRFPDRDGLLYKKAWELYFYLVEVLDYLTVTNKQELTSIGYNKPITGVYTTDVGISCSLSSQYRIIQIPMRDNIAKRPI